MNRIFLSGAALMSLSACTTVDDPFLQTGALKRDSASLASSVVPASALAALPGLAAASVRQTIVGERVEQTILYANTTDLAGENALTITVGKADKSVTRSPIKADIEAEMRTVLSGVSMRVSSVISENAYGVFGYATGTFGKSGACVYAWQRAPNLSLNGGSGRSASGSSARIRLRYCDPAMSPDRIALLMQGLRITPVSSETFRNHRFTAMSEKVAVAPAVEPIAAVAPVRPSRHSVPVKDGVSVSGGEKTINNAVTVPMPGEAAALAESSAMPDTGHRGPEQQVVATSALKPSVIPLPDMLAASGPAQ